MINLHIEANSVEELKNQMRELLGNEPTIQAQLLNRCIDAPTKALMDSLTAKTSGSTEPDKQAVPEEEQPKAEPEQPVKTYDLVAVRAAANAYKDKHGIEKLREIFAKHGGEKLKDIPEKNYAALMEDIA